ncbi:MAG: glycosyltransferase [Candidatus Marinimicrobia bacterium]|nr:glycosyltransferase [Candidatus Neomarinimicrobiota bacterium]
MYPRVSVIIPAYNAEKTIADLIISLSKQTFSHQKMEILVIDDCSTDGTPGILQAMEKEYHLRLFHHEKNQGLACTRNTGIKNSLGKILIFIDSDMTVGDHYIENHVNFHNNRHVMGVVGIIKPSPKMIYDKYQRYLYETKRGVKRYRLEKPIPYHAFIFGNTSIKREVIENCGLFDSNFKVYGGEDTEYAYRISQRYSKGLYGTCTLSSVHNHYRSFSDSLKNLEKFAEINIPYIIKKHPAMSILYGLKFFRKGFDNSTPIHRFIGALVYLRTFYLICLFLYNFLPFPLSNLWVRPIIAHRLLRGLKKGLPA